MSAPPNTRATVILADYIGVDQGGKLNVIGLGFTISGLQPTGATAPQYVAALIDYPATSAGDQVPITLELRDETTDSVVSIPDDAGGGQTALRIQQLQHVQRVNIPGIHLPQELPCRTQQVLAFPMGLPLTPGHKYAWKLEIDGTRLKGWSAHFYVPAPPPPPILGGPAGPASIPNVEALGAEIDDEDEGAAAPGEG